MRPIRTACFVAVVAFAGLIFAQSAPANLAADYSGMYGFLHEGEFVQLTVEDDGRLTGFVSRFGTLDSDRGAFLDQFFKTASLKGSQVTFTTDVIHGTSFDFVGNVTRGEGKTKAEEGYYVLKGQLTERLTDVSGKESASSRDVVFKSFPEDRTAPGVSSR